MVFIFFLCVFMSLDWLFYIMCYNSFLVLLVGNVYYRNFFIVFFDFRR